MNLTSFTGIKEPKTKNFEFFWQLGLKVGVSEGRVPTGGEGRAVAEVTGVGLEEGLGAGTCDEAGAKVGVEKSTADKVCAVEGEGREAVGSGTDGRRVGSSKGKRGSGKWERVSQTRERPVEGKNTLKLR